MKLGVKITLIVVSVIVAAIILAVGIGAGFANRINDKTTPIDALSYWQSSIKDETLLKSIAIPGAHDAGTNGMAWFSKTQSRNIADQLACGTRYLDLRVKAKDGEARIFHGPAMSLYLKDILRELREFLTANPTETVILDFQHFGGDDAKALTLQLLDELLSDLTVVNSSGKSDLEFIDALTIGKVRGKCIVFWGATDGTTASDKVFLRNDDKGTREGSCLQSYYTSGWNSHYTSAKYIKKALPAYIDMYKACDKGLFVLQGQLTDGALVMGPRYREGCHEKNMNEYLLAFADNENIDVINIVIRDFISPAKNSYTLRLNLAKGIVKDECIADYSDMIAEYIA